MSEEKRGHWICPSAYIEIRRLSSSSLCPYLWLVFACVSEVDWYIHMTCFGLLLILGWFWLIYFRVMFVTSYNLF